MDLTTQAVWEGLANNATEIERLGRWSDAYGAWLAGLQMQYSQNVWEDAHYAWKDFNESIHKLPWLVTPEDVERYQARLIERGRKASTIRIRLMNLRRFYDFCVRFGVDEELAGKENPFVQVEWPKVRSYNRPSYLAAADERKLLRTIQRDPSVTGRRDYALFLTLLSTGRPAGEVRKLQWRDLAFDGERTWISGKETSDRASLPAATWQAIETWLRASGRLESVQAEDYLFTPSKEPLVREAGNQAKDWDEERPLSVDELNYLVKLYAGWAGLNENGVTCHTLRNTAALRMQKNGESIQSIQTMMGRKDTVETRKYLKKLAKNGEAVGHCRKRLIRKTETIPSRKPGRAQPGNYLNLWHGFYAKSLPEMDALDEKGVHLTGTQRLIAMERFVLRRIMFLSKETKSLEKMLILLDLGSLTATRVSNLIYGRWRKESQPGTSSG